MNWGPMSIGAIEYYSQDTLSIAYGEGKYGMRLPFDASAIAGRIPAALAKLRETSTAVAKCETCCLCWL